MDLQRIVRRVRAIFQRARPAPERRREFFAGIGGAVMGGPFGLSQGPWAINTPQQLAAVAAAGLVAALSATPDANQQILFPLQDLRVHGALGDGLTDDAPALQAAHDALPADGGTIFVPPSAAYYRAATACTFSKPVRIVGTGWDASEFGINTQGLYFITTSKRILVDDCYFRGYGPALGDCTVFRHAADASGHEYSTWSRCRFSECYYGYLAFSANAPRFDGCKFDAIYGVGLELQNLSNSDIGDGFVTNCGFSGADASTGIGIHVQSMSGLYLQGNKFFAQLGHVYIENGAEDVGNFVVTGGSMEGHSSYGVKIVGTTGVCAKTLVTGVQFSSGDATHVVLGQGAKHSTIVGNSFSSTSSATGRGVDVLAGAEDANIWGNNFYQILSAIRCAAANVGVAISRNHYGTDVTTIFEGESDLNARPSTKEFEYAELASNSSDTVYVDYAALKGQCVLEVKIQGVVQGVGLCNYYRKVLVSGTTVTEIDAAVTTGAAFDVRYNVSGGLLYIGVKRATGVGTAVTAYLAVKVDGYVEQLTVV